MSEPLLSASGVVIAVDGVRAGSAFDLVSAGERLVLTGDVGPLLGLLGGYPLGLAAGARAAASGETSRLGHPELALGRLSMLDRDVATLGHLALVGAAPLDPPLDPEATVTEWLTFSARLAQAARGHRPVGRECVRQVNDVIDRAQLGALARAKLGPLSRSARRAMLLAHAALSDPRVLVAELPLSGLSEEDAAPVATALEALIEGRGAILSAARLDALSIEGGLAHRATFVAAFSGGQLVRSGPPADFFGSERRLYRVTVVENAEPLRAALARMDLVLDGGPDRFSLALPEGRAPLDVLRAAAAVRAAVVEIVPVM